MKFNEDTLVQKTTADYLHHNLGWESTYAYNDEDFGSGSLLGRMSDREVVLTCHLRAALEKLNRGLPAAAYDEGIRQIVETAASQTIVVSNREKYDLLRDGVHVTYREADNKLVETRLRVFDFDQPTENDFLCVRELWIRGPIYRRRADIVGFVNGIPLVFMECKNIHKDLRRAFDDNLSDYRDTIPHVFHHNAILVIGNGEKAKLGSITSEYGHFHEWKRLSEDDPGVVDMETLLKGVFRKESLLDIFESFIVFDQSAGPTAKIVARNHQYLGVNSALASLREREARKGKLGVFWHTQGSGKSYSMVFFARKAHRKLGGNFTFLVCTDRGDLDSQIYETFAGCGVVDNKRDPCRASSGHSLQRMLRQQKAFVFTLIQKFNESVDPSTGWTLRDDIVVLSDEAHRTQYGLLALNMRNALPNASYLGFTGTPLFKDDEITRRIFGDYVSTYDFQRAVDDGATVPLYYDARGEKLGIATPNLNVKIAEKLEQLEIEDIDVAHRLEAELKREYHILTAEKRLRQVAEDFVQHYSASWESGKAMIVCIDKVTCVRLYNLILPFWQERIEELEKEIPKIVDEQEVQFRRRQIQWMRETVTAVVVSEEQGEVRKFEEWDLDIKPHRKLLKEGFELADGKRIAVDTAFKRGEHPFRTAIVCAMWLTGFDVPSLANLYLDKPLKAHTLMQAVARANRVHEGKENGLLIDYCGILKNLRKALATFAGTSDAGHGGGAGEQDPARPEEELLAGLEEAIAMVGSFLSEREASLNDIKNLTGFARNAAIVKAKEAANENDETRKRFEILCREVFSMFKACITMRQVNAYRDDRNAINVVYKSLQKDSDEADITGIIRELQGLVDDAIAPRQTASGPDRTYDISKIDFQRLKREFERTPSKNTTVQCLKTVIEKRLQRMIAQNPLRVDFQAHYQKIVDEYNREKDRVTIEHTFEELLRFMEELGEEDSRAIREGLDPETVAIYDLLKRPDLSAKDIARIKQVAVELLAILKAEKLRVDQWREKEATRDAVRLAISDFLYSDETGLPAAYSDHEVKALSEGVFQYMFYAYPTVPSPLFAVAKAVN